MKKSFLTLITTAFIGSISLAQVAIGKATVDGDGLLDFDTSSKKGGIALPKILDTNSDDVADLNTSSVAGTIYFDTVDNRVKAKLASSTMDLSVMPVPEDDMYVIPNDYTALSESVTLNGTVIGAESSTVAGALVLESTDKALILPKVADPHTTIKDPEPGMIAYDTTTKMLCVYNGYKWSFWGEK